MILPIIMVVMVVVMYLLLPAILLLSLWKEAFQSRTEWYVKLLGITMYFVWIFFTGRWDWVGYPLRWIWAFLFLAAVFALKIAQPSLKDPIQQEKMVHRLLRIPRLVFQHQKPGGAEKLQAGG